MPDRIRSIVAGLADPAAPDLGVQAAVELARSTGAVLHLVHALPPALPRGGAVDDGSESEVLGAYAAYLRTRTLPLLRKSGPGPVIEVHARDQEPHAALLAVSARVGADLVVVGAAPHRRPGFGRLGITARRVVRRALRPVLLVRSGYAPPRRVLASTDLAPSSRRILRAALEVLGALAASPPPTVRVVWMMGAGVVPPPLPRDTLEQAGRAALERFLDDLGAGDRVEGSLHVGAPAEGILREAIAWGADLVVLGTHGRRGMRRIAMGSVAESVLAALTCNALVIPPGVYAAAAPAPREDLQPA